MVQTFGSVTTHPSVLAEMHLQPDHLKTNLFQESLAHLGMNLILCFWDYYVHGCPLNIVETSLKVPLCIFPSWITSYLSCLLEYFGSVTAVIFINS